jgi:hypothetical protein
MSDTGKKIILLARAAALILEAGFGGRCRRPFIRHRDVGSFGTSGSMQIDEVR